MNLLVDDNLSLRLAASIRAVVDHKGHVVKSVSEALGKRGALDEEWLGFLGANPGWFFLTADRRIRANPIEKKLLIESGASGFFLTPQWSPLSLHEKTGRILLQWQRILACSTAGSGAPQHYDVHPVGQFKIVNIR